MRFVRIALLAISVDFAKTNMERLGDAGACASLSESGFSGLAGFSGFRFARIALFAISGDFAKMNMDERLANPENPDSDEMRTRRYIALSDARPCPQTSGFPPSRE